MKKFFAVVLTFILFAQQGVGNTIPVHAASQTEANVFVSEYVEGSSYNKALEIYNGSQAEIDLSEYSLELYANGNTAQASRKEVLSGTLASGDVLVLVHGQASDELKALADKTSTVTNFNGDDAVVLKHNETIVDVVGTYGVKQNWGKDVTLVRGESVTSGNPAVDGSFAADEWDSYAKDTFSNLGFHNGTPGGGNENPTPPSDVTSIANARTQLGQTVTVEGILTADNSSLGGSKINTFIQDSTGGINVYASSSASFPDLKEGQKVRITGTITEYSKLMEIIPDQEGITVISDNNPLPSVKPLSLADLGDASLAEQYEGQLVSFSAYVKSIPAAASGGGYNITVTDADLNSLTVRVMETTGAINVLEAGKWYDFTGVLGQYTSYQLLPRKAGDIQLSDDQPDAPSAAGVYTSVVKSVVDGDTIHLDVPVLGTTKVRFVNIDTPETYHTPKNEADQNQKDHGEAAKAYIATLIQPGDEVWVKVGEEATDSYGRLLAQIIRKSDNLNVNLEMVRAGYAVTYFLWPVGDEVEYAEYQNAVQAAIDSQVGIWDPQNPLTELPFEFRAREQGKGLLRYVGDSTTHEYVEPALFTDVPVAHRIFFASAQEAESNGYTPKAEAPVVSEEPDVPVVTVPWELPAAQELIEDAKALIDTLEQYVSTSPIIRDFTSLINRFADFQQSGSVTKSYGWLGFGASFIGFSLYYWVK